MHVLKRTQSSWRSMMLLVGLILLGGLLLYWYFFMIQGNLLKQAEQLYIKDQISKIEDCTQKQTIECQSLAASVANDPAVYRAYQQSSRSNLNKLIMPVFSQWQTQYRVNQIQFISPQGLGVWDTNKPLGSADDLSYRRIIRQSLSRKEKMTAVESSDGTCSIVSTVPLFAGNKFIGICDLSISLDKGLGEKLKKIEAGNYGIFALDGVSSRLLWEKEPCKLALNTDDIKKVQQGKTFYRTSQDPRVMLAVVPLKDIDGIPLAYVQGEISRKSLADAQRYNYVFGFLIVVYIFLTSIWSARYFNNKIFRKNIRGLL